MELKRFKQILYKYLTNQADNAEQVMVEFWYRSYENKERAIDTSHQDVIKKAMWREIRKKSALPQYVARQQYYRLGIAASLVFALFIGLIFNWQKQASLKAAKEQQMYNSVSTTTGQIKYVILPDSSKIYLNANTSLRFKKYFNDTLREVFIEEGEAFFEVKHLAKRPFIVHAGQASTRVLGTSFNVKAYRSLNEFSVLVKTGKVQVSFKGKELGKLLPDERISIATKQGTFIRSTLNAAQYVKWQNKEVVLSNASFEELTLLIKNNYGLKLVAGNNKIKSYRFSIPLNLSSDIQTLMSQISKIHHNKFKLKGEQVLMY